MAEVRVRLQAADRIAEAGLRSFLADQRGITVLSAADPPGIDVLLLQVDQLTFEVVERLRIFALDTDRPVVLIIPEIDALQLINVVEYRVLAVLPRDSVNPDRLASAVLAAATGKGMMPASLVGDLLDRFRQLQREILSPVGLTLSGLTSRELAVLRLMAEGMDATEIATELRYSVRTVKTILYGVMSRYKLRNRAHAVAQLVRAGLI